MPARYKPRPDADQRTTSARNLVAAILNAPGVLMTHRREFIRLALWKVTMAEADNNLRYWSLGAYQNPDAKPQHEHAYRREKMADDLIASPERIDEILALAVGCRVTAEEHRRLNQVGKEVDGWERYARAGISVIDMKTGAPLDLSPRRRDPAVDDAVPGTAGITTSGALDVCPMTSSDTRGSGTPDGGSAPDVTGGLDQAGRRADQIS